MSLISLATKCEAVRGRQWLSSVETAVLSSLTKSTSYSESSCWVYSIGEICGVKVAIQKLHVCRRTWTGCPYHCQDADNEAHVQKACWCKNSVSVTVRWAQWRHIFLSAIWAWFVYGLFNRRYQMVKDMRWVDTNRASYVTETVSTCSKIYVYQFITNLYTKIGVWLNTVSTLSFT